MKIKILTTFLLLITLNAHADGDLDFLFKQNQNYKNVTVQKVVKADTIVIEDYTKKGETIKLIGLKAPEPPKIKRSDIKRDKYGFIIEEKTSPLSSMEERAFEFVKDLLEGKKVRIEFDRIKKDDKFVTIAYVFLIEDNIFANTEILRHGYADLSLSPRNKKYNDGLRAAYQEARREKRGIQGQ